MQAQLPTPISRALPTLTVALALEEALTRCVAQAARRLARTPLARAKLLPEDGSIDLPDSAPVADVARLALTGPLYMAHELQHAGLLRAAEQVAALYASGAITQDLGASAAAINEFWRTRHERLSDEERTQLLEQAFEERYFYGLMRAFCEAVVAMSDNQGVPDMRELVGLEQAGAQLASFLSQRTQGMVAFAAQDLVSNINTALSFLRERVLQTAFGAHDLWELVEICARATGKTAGDTRQRVDMARSGSEVLNWLAQPGALANAQTAGTEAITAAAVRWLSACESALHSPAAHAVS